MFKTLFRNRIKCCSGLLVLCLLLPLLLSCAEDEGTPDDKTNAAVSGDATLSSGAASDDASEDLSSEGSSESTDSVGGAVYTYPYETTDRLLSTLPTYDGEGSAFVIATDSSAPILEDGSYLSKAMEEVRDGIQKRYGMVVYYQENTRSELLSLSEAAVAKGEYFADLLAIPLSDLPSYLEKDLLMPLNLLPYYEADSARVGVTDLSPLMQDGKLYAAPGSGALTQLGSNCLLVNRELCEARGIDLDTLYEKVEEGSFTWEILLAELAKTPSSSDANPASLFGTTSTKASLRFVFQNSIADADLLQRVLSQTAERADLLTGKDASKAFYSGELCFLVTTLGDIDSYVNSVDSWGMLPLPKTVASDSSYVTLVDPDRSYVYVALKGSLRTEVQGLYLDSLHRVADGACLGRLPGIFLGELIREDGSLPTLGYLHGGFAFPTLTALKGYKNGI